MAKYNSYQVRKTNFPSALPHTLTGISSQREPGRNLNAHDFIHIMRGFRCTLGSHFKCDESFTLSEIMNE